MERGGGEPPKENQDGVSRVCERMGVGQRNPQGSRWTETSGTDSQLPSQHLTLLLPPHCSLLQPSIPVAFGKETLLLQSRQGHRLPVRALQSLDTHTSFHMVCWSLLDPSLHTDASAPAHPPLLPGNRFPLLFSARGLLTLT